MKMVFRSFLLLLFCLLFMLHCDSPTSSSKKSQILSIADVWRSDAEDYDGDEYYSYAHLNIDVDVSTGTKEVVLEVGIRPHDPADTSNYYLFASSPALTIEGSTQDDAVYLKMEGLPQGSYDILILVYNSSDLETPVVQALPEDDEDLGAVPIELTSTDVGLAIYDVFWVEEVDNDADGYKSEAVMVVDLNANYNVSSSVFLGIFGKLTSASNYELMAISDTFTVAGNSSNDAVGFRFTNTPLHDSYDFLVEAYYYYGIGTEDQANKLNDPDLGNVLLEPASEDLKTETLSHYDGIFEDAIWYTSGDFSALTRFVVGFEKPANAGTCFVRAIRFYLTSNANNYRVPVKLCVIGTNSNLYSAALPVYVMLGWNYYEVNVDVTNESEFYAGYLQTQANWPQLSTDTTWPHSGQSFWHNGSAWVAETGLDYAIAVDIEYEITGSTKQNKIVREWLPASVSAGMPQTVNSISDLP